MGKEKLDGEKEREKGKGEIERRKKIRGNEWGKKNWTGKKKEKKEKVKLREGRKSEER